MKLVMIESPFANPSLTEHVENILYARKAMHDALKRGEAPLASHLLYPQEGILDESKADERQWGINAGYAWGDVAEAIIFYTDRGWSRGMIAAYNYYSTYPHRREIELRSLHGEAVPPPVIIPSKEST